MAVLWTASTGRWGLAGFYTLQKSQRVPHDGPCIGDGSRTTGSIQIRGAIHCLSWDTLYVLDVVSQPSERVHMRFGLRAFKLWPSSHVVRRLHVVATRAYGVLKINRLLGVGLVLLAL